MPEVPKNKKQIILDTARSFGIAKAGDAEIRRLQAHLAEQFGIAARPSSSYIVRTLREAGIPVETRTPFAGSSIQEPYASRLKGLLQFQNLQVAEVSLRKLHAAFEEYRAAGDGIGVRQVRALALKGKQRAAAIAHNSRVDPANRKEKREIVNWFRVWLESPHLFFVWVEVRKKSDEFRREFGDRVAPDAEANQH
ncbi:MAG: hypothetical protein ACRD2O_10870 [Terriglobia bacterium]